MSAVPVNSIGKRCGYSFIFPLFINSKTAAEWRTRTIYQLLTDRFAHTPDDIETNKKCLHSPLSYYDIRHYCGGTYKGIISHLNYIKQMGFDAIWISPITAQIENDTHWGVGWHGYWQDNIYGLNEHFGTENDLRTLIKAAHTLDIWVMLDVVANHMGPNVNGTARYVPFDLDIYYHQPPCLITDYTNQSQVEFCTVGDINVPLPDLNTEHEFVVSTLNQWIRNIINEYEFDGIRIDTFRHVRKPFWTDYVSASGVYSVGEVATSDTAYVGDYQRYADGVLHYPLYFVLNEVFRDENRKSIREIDKQVQLNEEYFIDTTLCGVFLDNHDQARFMNHTKNMMLIKNALTYLMFSDGIPIFYYGTEQEYHGDTDPWNREPMWHSNYSQSTPIYHFVKQLLSLRAILKLNYPQYFLTHQRTVYIDDSTYVYYKYPVLIILSNDDFNQPKTLNIPINITNYIEFFTKTKVRRDQLVVNSWTPMILVPQDNLISST
ncbi:unnamed protein product [Didymodactylos carnosus]|uniref:alpha-amylase n=1 Tax=Didymodactylos carnosus TaxID=1234261 RepID=A0A8S2D0Y4_9BILA|nr:unnamed protein product [Didymodactylos carnosus]CAF3569106.1 unnamed protein product [Didymodactylos carnosus]